MARDRHPVLDLRLQLRTLFLPDANLGQVLRRYIIGRPGYFLGFYLALEVFQLPTLDY